jgi:hypothetical protein
MGQRRYSMRSTPAAAATASFPRPQLQRMEADVWHHRRQRLDYRDSNAVRGHGGRRSPSARTAMPLVTADCGGRRARWASTSGGRQLTSTGRISQVWDPWRSIPLARRRRPITGAGRRPAQPGGAAGSTIVNGQLGEDHNNSGHSCHRLCRRAPPVDRIYECGSTPVFTSGVDGRRSGARSSALSPKIWSSWAWAAPAQNINRPELAGGASIMLNSKVFKDNRIRRGFTNSLCGAICSRSAPPMRTGSMGHDLCDHEADSISVR